jgi:hypothetical protein
MNEYQYLMKICFKNELSKYCRSTVKVKMIDFFDEKYKLLETGFDIGIKKNRTKLVLLV